MRKSILIAIVLLAIGFGAGRLFAGSVDSPGGPTSSAAQMYTLEQIYQRLTTGNYFAKQSGFTEPSGGPGTGTGHTLNEIMAQAQPRALAKRVAKTGQTTCYDSIGRVIPCAGSGQDGQYQMGIDPVVAPTLGYTYAYNTPAWTGVRFVDNGDGTVTDNLTALIWLKNANCFGVRDWASALDRANLLASPNCGLSDGSSASAWRLPNVNELHSLGPTWPPGGPFTGVQSSYWTSGTDAGSPSYAYYVYLPNGFVGEDVKTLNYDVWPVRGGQ